MSFITMVQPIIQCCFIETPHSQKMREIIGINMCPAGLPPPTHEPSWATEFDGFWLTESNGNWLLE